MELISVRAEEMHEANEAYGTKAHGLFEMQRLGVNVPPFFVVSSFAFDACLEKAGIIKPVAFFRRPVYTPEALNFFSAEQKIAFSLNIPDDWAYMVRSSCVPLPEQNSPAFASMVSGAFESYYAQSKALVANYILAVWKSLYTEKAYTQLTAIAERPMIKSLAVILQKYATPVVSGVAHTRNGHLLINWVDGHLSKIVRGETSGNVIDAYLSDVGGSILRGIEADILKAIGSPVRAAIPQLISQARIICAAQGCEQEIEWVYDGEMVWIVQTQPLLTSENSSV